MAHSVDSRNELICAVIDIVDWHIFTWKIHNLSLVPNVVDYVVQSPSFYFENASWILKMYLYGQTQFKTEGYMDITIERLNSETPMSHKLFCKIYRKDPSNKEFGVKYFEFGFDSQWTYSRVNRFMQSPKESELKDPFTLVFEIGTKEPVSRSYYTKAAESTVGQEGTINTNIRSPEIGEVFSEYLEFKALRLTVHPLSPTSPFPTDYQVSSPQFSFANALWILKFVPYYTDDSSRRNVRVVLERLQSKIPEQKFMFKISVDYADGDITIDRSMLFNSSHTEEEVLYFSCFELFFRVYISLKIKNTDAESAIDDCGISRPSGVLRNFKNLFLSEDGTDIIIRVKEQQLRAHKLVLKAQAPVFAAAFQSDMQENVINMEDCDPATFRDFLCFLYCGEVRKLSDKTAFDLFTLANKYNISDLRSLCMEFIKMNLSVNIFCDTLEFALQHSESDPELIELSRDFFAKNSQKILETDKWKSFADQNPELSNEIKALAHDDF